MSIIKCKLCGGELELPEGQAIAFCSKCGMRQVLPSTDNVEVLTRFNRAARLLRSCEYDKAEWVYRSVIAEYPEESEAYWGILLSKYGVAYSDTPHGEGKAPLCHRPAFESVLEDPDFELAQEYASAPVRKFYREEARRIEENRRGLVELADQERTRDVILCCLEFDEEQKLTGDAERAQELYALLTERGFRVFFSKASYSPPDANYEARAFAALRSAEVLLVLGSDYDYFNAPWVKNLWSRFLKLKESGRKKALLSCFWGMDAQDLPKELSAQPTRELNGENALEEVLAEAERLTGGKDAESTVPSDGLERRAAESLRNKEWTAAAECYRQLLRRDPEDAGAHLGLAMAEAEFPTREALSQALISGGYQPSEQFLRAEECAAEDLADWFHQLRSSRLRSAEQQQEELERTRRRIAPAGNLLATGFCHTVALKADGTVLATGENDDGQCNVSDWRDIVAVTAGDYHTVGLRRDGTAVAVGKNTSGQCEVTQWRDLVAVAAGDYHTVGLRRDGTVVAVGKNDDGRCDVGSWRDVVALASVNDYTVGLKNDGTVLGAGARDAQGRDFTGWRDMTVLTEGTCHTLGLRRNGTVAATGSNDSGECAVNGWRDIVAVAAGADHSVGVKADGTVVTAGRKDEGACDVEDWRDIVAVAAGSAHTVGLQSDGTVLAVGDNSAGQCNVEGWKLFNSLDDLSPKT